MRESAGQGMYSQLQKSDLKGSHIGNQKLTGRLFILSVDEALKYSKWLWRFDGSEKENPQSRSECFPVDIGLGVLWAQHGIMTRILFMLWIW